MDDSYELTDMPDHIREYLKKDPHGIRPLHYRQQEWLIQGGSDFLGGIDAGSIQVAVQEMMKEVHRIDDDETTRIKKMELEVSQLSGINNEFGIDWLIAEYHQSIYHQALRHQLIAFMHFSAFEAIVTAGFRQVSSWPAAGNIVKNGHARWVPTSNKMGNFEKIWDCHYFKSPNNKPSKNEFQKGIAKGFRELAEATGLSRYLPEDYCDAIFNLTPYRNNSAHHGLEWSKDERRKFGEALLQGDLRAELV